MKTDSVSSDPSSSSEGATARCADAAWLAKAEELVNAYAIEVRWQLGRVASSRARLMEHLAKAAAPQPQLQIINALDILAVMGITDYESLWSASAFLKRMGESDLWVISGPLFKPAPSPDSVSGAQEQDQK